MRSVNTLTARVVCGHCRADLTTFAGNHGMIVECGGGIGVYYPADAGEPVIIGKDGAGVRIELDGVILHECGAQPDRWVQLGSDVSVQTIFDEVHRPV